MIREQKVELELSDLLKIAKRENNSKRSYLYVNTVQGKHIPTSPTRSLHMFKQLAEKVEKKYNGEKILVIGFAETATAIGSAVAYIAKNCMYYMNTTREDIPNVEYLIFTESHSHATEQRLVANGLDRCIDEVNRIVFVEDEVTTGNTIEKLIRIIQNRYSNKKLQFGIISVLNSMNEQRIYEFQKEGIVCDYLHHISSKYRAEDLNSYDYMMPRKEVIIKTGGIRNVINVGDYWNSRIVSDVNTIHQKVNSFVKDIIQNGVISKEDNKILILGTEEFMFPGILLGKEIETLFPRKIVKFHATTRSPIEVCNEKEYPLHNRMPLWSVYEDDRRTFIYNLSKYDKVLIVTDAQQINNKGIDSIIAALEYFENKNIKLICWGNN